MATHASALKRDRQSKARQERNRAIRSRLKTLIKNVRNAPADPARRDNVLREAVSALASAASRGAIHRNTASRNISRLTHLVQKTPGSAQSDNPKK